MEGGYCIEIRSKSETSFRRAVIRSYITRRTIVQCATVVKLKMPITLATDMLETYTLHFWKWEKKFL